MFLPNWRQIKSFLGELFDEITKDNMMNGAAALAYYLIFSIFPAMILLLAVLPYLPVDNLDQAIMDWIRQAMPASAASMFEEVVVQITQQKRGGLLSFGLLVALWAASNGLYAVMQQINVAYNVRDQRPFWKVRGTALLMTLLFGMMVVGAFTLIIFGGVLQEWLASFLGWGQILTTTFALFRWSVILSLLFLCFALIYYYGPDVEQKFRFITPGSIVGVFLLGAASLAFSFYVSNFANYSKTYGSIGAVIILLLWLYIAGAVILLGAEINSLIEHHHPEAKSKGERSFKRKEPALEGTS